MYERWKETVFHNVHSIHPGANFERNVSSITVEYIITLHVGYTYMHAYEQIREYMYIFYLIHFLTGVGSNINSFNLFDYRFRSYSKCTFPNDIEFLLNRESWVPAKLCKWIELTGIRASQALLLISKSSIIYLSRYFLLAKCNGPATQVYKQPL